MRASIVFVCIVFALSCVNAEYLVKKEYAESSTCSSSSFSAAGVWNTNQCFSVGTDYNKYTISGNKVTLYSECDSLCKTCGSNDGTYTLNACNTETVDGDTNSFSFYTSAKVPTDWSSEPTRVMYGNTQCTGDWAAIFIDASEDSCPFISSQEGLCTTNDQFPGSSFKPYCSMPSDINGGGKPTTKPSTPSSPAFDLNGYFVVTSLYDSSSCSGKPANATIQPPGTCWNMMDILSVKYDINNGQVTEYFCSGSDCSSDCTIIPVPLDTCISDDIEKKRSTLLKAKKQALGISEDDSVYGSISIVKGFPTSITKGKTLVVAYDQTTCKGSPTQMSTLDTPCVETCTLLGKSFCSYDSFAKTIPKKLGGKEGSSSMVVIIVVVVVLVAVAAIIGAVVAFVVRRRKHGHHHSVNDHHDYRPLMQGDHHHGDHH